MTESLTKHQALKATWKRHASQTLVESRCKRQLFNCFECLWEVVQVVTTWRIVEFCHSLHCSFISISYAFHIAPGIIQTCGHACAGQGCSSSDALFIQCFLKKEFGFHVMQDKLCASLAWKLFRHHPVDLPSKDGVVDIECEPFIGQTQHLEINGAIRCALSVHMFPLHSSISYRHKSKLYLTCAFFAAAWATYVTVAST